MSEKVKDDISRRKALSLLGGALGLALAVDALASEEAEAHRDPRRRDRDRRDCRHETASVAACGSPSAASPAAYR